MPVLAYPPTIPEFEKYIGKFQEKYSDHLYTDFTYPHMPLWNPCFPTCPELPNILVPDDTLFEAGKAYSMAAFIPLNSTLTIKFIGDNSNYNYSIGGPVSGWQLINEFPGGFVLNSQRRNDLMTMLFHLEKPEHARIEYYENGSLEPSFTKLIRWE